MNDASNRVYRIRSDISDFLGIGLNGMDRERVLAIAESLNEMKLAKPAEMVKALLDQTDPEARFEQFVKVIQMLRQVELRLAGLEEVDVTGLEPLPVRGGIYLKTGQLPADDLDLAGIFAIDNLFYREYALNRYLCAIDLQTMRDKMEYLWGNAALMPRMISMLAAQPQEALDLVRHSFQLGHKVVILTALNICAAIGSAEAHQLFLEARRHFPSRLGEELAFLTEVGLQRKWKERGEDWEHPSEWRWPAFRYLEIEANHIRPEKKVDYLRLMEVVRETFSDTLHDLKLGKADSRTKAARRIASSGCPAFIPVMAWAWSRETKMDTQKNMALGRACCGDLEFIDMLLTITQASKLSDIYCQGLAILGDVRGKSLLVSAFEQKTNVRISGYGKQIVPDMFNLMKSTKIGKKENAINPFLQFPLADITAGLEEVINERPGVNSSILLMKLVCYADSLDSDRKKRIIEHAAAALTCLKEKDQVEFVKGLKPVLNALNNIMVFWPVLRSQGRREVLKILAHHASLFQQYYDSNKKWSLDIVRAETWAAIVDALISLEDKKIDAALLETIEKNPSVFHPGIIFRASKRTLKERRKI